MLLRVDIISPLILVKFINRGCGKQDVPQSTKLYTL